MGYLGLLIFAAGFLVHLPLDNLTLTGIGALLMGVDFAFQEASELPDQKGRFHPIQIFNIIALSSIALIGAALIVWRAVQLPV